MVSLTEIAVQTDSARLFAGYDRPDEGPADEAFAPDGTPWPHWRRFLDWLTSVGPEGYRDAAHDLMRLRVESGIAFAPDGAAGAEDEDTIPVILSTGDWAQLEAGIIQRARLAEAAIADVYTDARIVSAGLVPPGLVYGGPAFAAHCAGWQHPPRQWLHVYGGQRRPDGRGRVGRSLGPARHAVRRRLAAGKPGCDGAGAGRSVL